MQTETRTDDAQVPVQVRTDVKDSIRQDVINAYGGKCCCCGADDPRTLVLVYEDKEALVKEEDGRRPKQGTLEWIWLHRNNFPQNGRKIACRSCCRYVPPGKFPASNKCGINHDSVNSPPRYATDEPNEAAVRATFDLFKKWGWEIHDIRPFNEFWRLPKSNITQEESAFLEYYWKQVRRLYQKARYHARKERQTELFRTEVPEPINNDREFVVPDTVAEIVFRDLDDWATSQ